MAHTFWPQSPSVLQNLRHTRTVALTPRHTVPRRQSSLVCEGMHDMKSPALPLPCSQNVVFLMGSWLSVQRCPVGQSCTTGSHAPGEAPSFIVELSGIWPSPFAGTLSSPQPAIAIRHPIVTARTSIGSPPQTWTRDPARSYHQAGGTHRHWPMTVTGMKYVGQA